MNKVVYKILSVLFSILMVLLVIFLLVRLGSFCYGFGYRVFTEAPIDEEPGRDIVVQITSDMSEREIGKMLENRGLIEDGNLFLAQLKLSAYSGDLKAGVYTLNTSMTAKEMMAVMAADVEETETEEEQDTGYEESDVMIDDMADSVTDIDSDEDDEGSQ
jgi:UPF0755 protein